MGDTQYPSWPSPMPYVRTPFEGGFEQIGDLRERMATLTERSTHVHERLTAGDERMRAHDDRLNLISSRIGEIVAENRSQAAAITRLEGVPAQMASITSRLDAAEARWLTIGRVALWTLSIISPMVALVLRSFWGDVAAFVGRVLSHG